MSYYHFDKVARQVYIVLLIDIIMLLYIVVVEMKRVKKTPTLEDDLDFGLLKEELNKELLSFWKAITEDEVE
jgi:hypothetical protein